MELIFACLLILFAIFFYTLVKKQYQEGLDSNPMEVVQSQQGEIENIRKQLIATELTEASVKELQEETDTLTDQINTLQGNMPDPQVKKYAQE